MDNYVASQILVIIATVFIGMTYLLKERKKILILFILYSMFYGVHYLLLGALTGFLMNMVSIIRNIIFFINNKKDKDNSILFLILLYSCIIIFTIYSYKDIYSIVSMTASLISTYSVWQKNIVIYRLFAMIVSILFIIYAVHIGSLFAIITEAILLLVEIVGACLLKLKK